MSQAIANEHYSCVEIHRFPLGDNSDLVYFANEKVSHILPSDMSRVLEVCRSFKSIDEHAHDVCTRLRLGNNRVPNVRKLLNDFVQAGMLVGRQELLAECLELDRSADVPSRIATLGVLTRDRTPPPERFLRR